MQKLLTELLRIEQDNRSGSVTIVDEIIHCLLEFCNRTGDQSLHPDLSSLLDSLRNLVTAHNQFAALQHFYEYLSDVLEKENCSTGQNLNKYLIAYYDRWKGVNDEIAHTLAKKIDLKNKHILVHSQSSALIRSFHYLKERGGNATIFQTESRPALEGRRQAEILIELGFDVHLIVDSAISSVIDLVDLTLLGADNVTPDFFSNKIGSLGIILICREVGIPTYVLADTRKFISTDLSPNEKPKSGLEIWEGAPKKLAIVNFYFERIPNNLVDGFITEETLETALTLKSKFHE